MSKKGFVSPMAEAIRALASKQQQPVVSDESSPTAEIAPPVLSILPATAEPETDPSVRLTSLRGRQSDISLQGVELGPIQNVPLDIIKLPDGLPDDGDEVELRDPRSDAKAKAEDEQLAVSIAELGVLEPIIIERDPHSLNGYRLVVGRRRFRASIAAGKASIRAQEVKFANSASRRVVEAAENLNRRNFSKAEKIRAYIKVVAACEGNKALAARMLGISRTLLYRYLDEATAEKSHTPAKAVGHRWTANGALKVVDSWRTTPLKMAPEKRQALVAGLRALLETLEAADER